MIVVKYVRSRVENGFSTVMFEFAAIARNTKEQSDIAELLEQIRRVMKNAKIGTYSPFEFLGEDFLGETESGFDIYGQQYTTQRRFT